MSCGGSQRPGDRIQVGRIVRPHGVRGELVAECWSDLAGRFVAGAELQLGSGGSIRLLAARPHRDRVLLSVEGISDRDRAERLRGEILEVPRAQVPAAPAGSYYHFELIGCLLSDRSAGVLGRVTRVLEDGGGLLLEVAEEGEQAVLIPFVGDYLLEIDLAARRIVVDLPEGLIEACISTS